MEVAHGLGMMVLQHRQQWVVGYKESEAFDLREGGRDSRRTLRMEVGEITKQAWEGKKEKR